MSLLRPGVMKQHKLKLFLGGGNYKIKQNHPAPLPNICVAMLVLMGLPKHVWTCLNRGKLYATRIHPLVMAQTRYHVASVFQYNARTPAECASLVIN